jgi:eukaryotic-like serine/threonine-protein kinase
MPPGDLRGVEDSLGLKGRCLLDRYEVGDPIAHGGMAIIYGGRDRRLFRPVCIKVFHRLRPGEAAYRTAYDHFVQEAFALSRFSHPNTLRIYDFGYLDGEVAAPFFISELLEGGTLSQLVRRHGALGPGDAQEILEPVAGALAEAHARGIVHRDIKPSNILFGLAGARRVVKLCDFGIAKVVDLTAARDRGATDHDWHAMDTHLGAGMPMRLFSPGWAAPEQIDGDPVGPPADIYALGLVTGYVLSGRALLTGKDILPGEPYDPEVLISRTLAQRSIPTAMAELIQSACRTRVAERIGSADAFAEELRAAVRLSGRRRARSPDTDAEAHVAVPESVPEPVLDELPGVPALPAQRVRAAMPGLPLPAPPAVPPRGTSPALPMTPAALPLDLDAAGQDEVMVAGRRLRLVALTGGLPLDLGGDGPYLRSPARFRVTITQSLSTAPRVHIKGLNCFVLRAGGRPSTAIDLDADADVDLIAADRRALDSVRCSVGRPDAPAAGRRLFDVGVVTIAVPAVASAVLFDLGPGRDLALLHHGGDRRRR